MRVSKLCVEIHGNQLVYNVPALLRLRAAIGPIVGANLDPSHLMWMGADPRSRRSTRWATPSCIATPRTPTSTSPPGAHEPAGENGSLTDIPGRSGSYITLGYGHDEAWWRAFCYRLRMVGYDGWLAIEHEDIMLSRIEGARRSVDVLRARRRWMQATTCCRISRQGGEARGSAPGPRWGFKPQTPIV